MIHSTQKYNNIYFIGTNHSKTDHNSIINKINELEFKPDIICVEGPDCFDPNLFSEHKAVKIYIQNNKSVDFKRIDKRRGNFVPDKDPIKGNMDHIDKNKKYNFKGVLESVNPDAFENKIERDQMMALEIRDIMKDYDTGVVIVGDLHTDGIINQLNVLENKY